MDAPMDHGQREVLAHWVTVLAQAGSTGTGSLPLEIINVVANLSGTAMLVVAVWAFSQGKITTGKALEKVIAESREREERTRKDCEDRITRLEAKLDASADAIRRQSEAQQQTIAVLEATLKRQEGGTR